MSENKLTVFTDAQLQAVKHKMKTVLTHLVETHIQRGGVYYEIKPDATVKENFSYARSPKTARTIAVLMLPYVLWVLGEYVKRINGVDAGYFTFNKKQDLFLKDVFHLDFQIQQKAIPNIPTILMYMVVVFQDHFESDSAKKIAINRLCYLLVK